MKIHIDLANMTNRAQIHEFHKKVKWGNCYRSSHSFFILVFYLGYGLAKFQQNISKIMEDRQKIQGHIVQIPL